MMGSEESKVPNTAPPTEWDPFSFCDADVNWEAAGKPAFALLILNRRISNKDRFSALWKNSLLRVCADGGANRLYDSLRPDERPKFLPHSIIGDLDSLRGDVRQFYESYGVVVTKDPDQDSTDFEKCVTYISSFDPPDSFVTPATVDAALTGKPTRIENPKMSIVALGGFGGRMDQSFHSIHALHVAQQEPGLPRRIVLVSDENVTFLLATGLNILRTPQTALGPCCGIIPVGKASIISTKGFEWNLDIAETKFGGMVSTSNHTIADVVYVDTTEPILFTIEFRK